MKSSIFGLLSALFLSAVVGVAQEAAASKPTFAVSLEGGTTGVGGSLWITASDRVTISVGYAAADFDDDYSTDEADYSGTVKLANGHALLHWHPFKGLMHFSVGAILANDKVDATAFPAFGTTYEFNGVPYPAVLVGNLDAHVAIADSVAPYAGFGWSSRPTRRGFGFFVDLGVMYSGSAKATLTADGPLASDPTFQANLEQERADLQHELDRYKFYPVVRAGVMYRF